MRRATLVLACGLAAAGLLAAGCGGGGVGVTGTDGAVLEGTVYSSGVSPASTGDTKAAQGDPVPDCDMTVQRARDRQQLATGRTDAQGRYRFAGLPAGEDVVVQAHLRSGDLLQTRLRLRDGTCQADVTEDTTLVATAQGMVDTPGQPATTDDAEVGQTVAQACMQHQQQHRYRYGGLNGSRPDFANAGEVEGASLALMRAAAADAVGEARQTAGEADCRRAAELVAAQLRAEGHTASTWTSYVRRRVAWSLMQRQRWTPEEVATAMRRINSAGASARDMERVRDRIRQMIRDHLGQDLDAIEAVGGVCVGDGQAERTRLRTRAQIEQFAQELIGDPPIA